MSNMFPGLLLLLLVLATFPVRVYAKEMAWNLKVEDDCFTLCYGENVLLKDVTAQFRENVLHMCLEDDYFEPTHRQIIIGLLDEDKKRISELTIILADTPQDSLARIDLEPEISLTANPSWGRNPFLCRLNSARDERIYHVRSGESLSPAANSLYDPHLDQGLELDGFRFVDGSHNLTVTASGKDMVRIWIRRDVIKKQGINYFTPLNREEFVAAPTGWCSWYSYYQNITANEWEKNVIWLAQNLRDYGLEWVQLDDGWQAQDKDPHTSGGRDWFNTNNKFPGGMKQIADIVKENRLRPGIWLIPQKIDRDDLYKANPDYFLHYQDGSPVKHTDWAPGNRAMYVVDVTNQDALINYYRPLIEMIVNDWGFEYLKIDDQPRIANLYKDHRIVFSDPSFSGVEAYRLSLKEIKDILGPTGYLLGCYGIPLEGVGIMDGSRTGGDMGASWAGSRIIIDTVFRWGFTNGLAWWCDPDTVCVRSPLTEDEAKMLASMVTLTGQTFMASDFMYQLPKERVEILKRSMPTLSTYPVELYPWDTNQRNRPSVILNSISKDWGNWYVAAIYQWSEELEAYRSMSPNNQHAAKIIGLLEGKQLTDSEIDQIFKDSQQKAILKEKVALELSQPAKEVTDFALELNNVEKIELLATDGADNNLGDWAQWADLKITKADGSVYYLSDNPPGVRIVSYDVAWGLKGINTNSEGQPINIKGQGYKYGFAAHAPSKIVLELSEDYVRLEGIAGLETGHNGNGSVSMHVLLDNVPKFNTYLSRNHKVKPIIDHLREPELINEISFTELQLPANKYHVFDFWEDCYLGLLEDKITLSPRPFSVNILAVVPDLGRPQLISTNRHISQGAVDVKTVIWDQEHLVLSGTSEVVAGDNYELRIAVPNDYQLVRAKADGVPISTSEEPNLTRIKLTSPETTLISWQIQFASK